MISRFAEWSGCSGESGGELTRIRIIAPSGCCTSTADAPACFPTQPPAGWSGRHEPPTQQVGRAGRARRAPQLAYSPRTSADAEGKVKMPVPDFDTASGIVGRNIRDAFLSSASCAVTSIERTPVMPQLRLPTAISPRIRLIRRGKGPRRQFNSHLRARGTPRAGQSAWSARGRVAR
jgi:hypothetical protein